MNPKLHPAVVGLIATALVVLGAVGTHEALYGDYSQVSTLNSSNSKSSLLKPPISPEPPPKLSNDATVLHHAYVKPDTYGPSKANGKTYGALAKTIEKSLTKYNASAPESSLILTVNGLPEATKKLLTYVLDKGLQMVSDDAGLEVSLVVTLADKNTFANMLSSDASDSGGKGIDGKKRTSKQWKQIATQEWNKRLQAAYAYTTGETDEDDRVVIHLILFKGALEKLSSADLIDTLVHELVHIKAYALYGAGESAEKVAPLLSHTTKMFHDTALAIVKKLK